PVSRVDPSGSASYYDFDGRGNVVDLSDASGAIVNRYAYDPFGNILYQSGSIPNPFQFAGIGGAPSENGGNGLILMGKRLYDPAMGRFVGRNPIGIAGGTNAYSYVQNHPVQSIQPVGTTVKSTPVGGAAPGHDAAGGGSPDAAEADKGFEPDKDVEPDDGVDADQAEAEAPDETSYYWNDIKKMLHSD